MRGKPGGIAPCPFIGHLPILAVNARGQMQRDSGHGDLVPPGLEGCIVAVQHDRAQVQIIIGVVKFLLVWP